MSTKRRNWSTIRSAMKEAVSRWIYDPNVMYVDFGWRERGGVLRDTEPPCIRVHVIKKLAEPALQVAMSRGVTGGWIEDTIAGFPVDVPEESFRLQQPGWGGRWRQQADPRKGRSDPMQGGISVSDGYRYIAGTLGGLVKDRESGKPMLLSNFHVLAGSWYARAGWPICQPGRGDGGGPADLVARLSRHAMASDLDAAVAELTGSRKLVNNQLELAPVTGMGWAQVGMKVIKSGRTSGVTRGRVTGVEGTVKLRYSGVKRLIRNVIKIEPRRGPDVSSPGDSGSFWLDEETMKAVGLHFASGERSMDGLAIDMAPVLEALDVIIG
ncbi:MAG: hypothetical protein PVH95_06680 [Anaerolineae bacterium]